MAEDAPTTPVVNPLIQSAVLHAREAMHFSNLKRSESQKLYRTYCQTAKNEENSPKEIGGENVPKGEVFLGYFEVEVAHPFKLAAGQDVPEIQQYVIALMENEKRGATKEKAAQIRGKPEDLMLLHKGCWCGHIANMYPSLTEDDLPAGMWSELIPEGIHFYRKPKIPEPRFFTYAKTDEKGNRTFVHCLITYEPVSQIAFQNTSVFPSEFTPSNIYVPRAYALLTVLPIFASSCDWLNAFYENVVMANGNNPEMRTKAIKDLISVKMPPPMCQCIMPTINGTTVRSFVAPNPKGLPYLDPCLLNLITHVGVDMFVEIFTHALVEHRLIFVSENAQLIVEMCQAMDALMYPLKWVGPFIPCLNFNTKMALQSLTPGGMFGMSTFDIFMSLAKDERPKEYILIQLDKKRVECNGKNMNVSLPQPLKDMLISNLNSCLSDTLKLRTTRWTASSYQTPEEIQSFDHSVRATFLFLMSTIFVNHRSALLQLRHFPRREIAFRTQWYTHSTSGITDLMDLIMEGQNGGYFISNRPFPEGDLFDYCDFYKMWRCATRDDYQTMLVVLTDRLLSEEYMRYEADPYATDYVVKKASKLNDGSQAFGKGSFEVLVMDAPLSGKVENRISLENPVGLFFTPLPAQCSVINRDVSDMDRTFIVEMSQKIAEFNFTHKEASELKEKLLKNVVCRNFFVTNLITVLRNTKPKAWKIMQTGTFEYLGKLLIDLAKVCVKEYDYTALVAIIRVAVSAFISTPYDQKFLWQSYNFAPYVNLDTIREMMTVLINDAIHGLFIVQKGNDDFSRVRFEKCPPDVQRQFMDGEWDCIKYCFLRLIEMVNCFRVDNKTVMKVLNALVKFDLAKFNHVKKMFVEGCHNMADFLEQHETSVRERVPAETHIVLWVDDKILSPDQAPQIEAATSHFLGRTDEHLHVEKFTTTGECLEWLQTYGSFLTEKSLRIITNRYRPGDGGDNAAINLVSAVRKLPVTASTPICIFCGDKNKVVSAVKSFRFVYVATTLVNVVDFLEKGKFK